MKKMKGGGKVKMAAMAPSVPKNAKADAKHMRAEAMPKKGKKAMKA